MTTSRAIDRADIDALRRAVRGAVHRPSDPGYAVEGFNVAATWKPWAVVDVAGADDVAAVVNFAAANGMTVAPFATGHGGIPIGSNSILVRTNGLDVCEVDPATRTARLGAGVRWQTVIDAAAPHGLAPLCGSSPAVSVGGFLSGGGIGPLVRTVGASCDHVRSITAVTGTGVVKQATAEVNPELFWGLRGGKGTLGIITEVVIDLLPISEIYGGAIYFDGADAQRVLRVWRDWTEGLPREANTSLAVLNLPDMPGVPPMLAGRQTVAVRFAGVGDFGAAADLVAPIRAVATPILDTVGPMPYAAIAAIHADPVDPMPAHETSTLLRALPDDALAALLEVVGPGAPPFLTITELRLLGGAFAEEPPVRSALCHRHAAFTFHTVGVLAPPIAEHVVDAGARASQAIAPWSLGTTLPNFIAHHELVDIRTSYDDDTYAWLSALGAQLDPHGVLDVGHVVR
ncbi:FAD-binding oxidoreductase [Gordonia desulfuricans]|uniref:FAD-binding oxidoreductase n=1 Tax=Gordonia desulfuricans TaxID=89051 RepID=A0A7K3LUC9_9ACTN|nr:FAD-binding protein [Gordonia desulfuricans]NDK91880.1 FAD-binding oxidoreductase [Gordonia desulfuricans]